MLRPMPSPRGTNRENAFLPSGSPVAAYDAAMSDGARKRVTDFLAGKLTDADMATIQKMIADEADDPDEPSVAQDARTFRAGARARYESGQISYDLMQQLLARGPGYRQSQDDAKRFNTMFPGAARIKVR